MTAALWQVSVMTTRANEEFASRCLARAFAEPASTYFDVRRRRSTVSVYCSSRPTKVSLALLRRVLSIREPPLQVELRRLGPRDWAEAWKRHFRPISIGRRLLIKPSWSKKKPFAGEHTVVLDPGLSFGTGQHPTTRFCLEQIVALRPVGERKSFLDVGTGSGILAIAARKLGYRPVDAIDLDPVAVRIARSNAVRNRVQVNVQKGDALLLTTMSGAGYDLICANLTSDLLRNYASELTAQVGLGGCLVLAGILERDFRRVLRVYEGLHWRLTKTRRIREWQSGAFVAI